MARIVQLSAAVANQIAAGEVVERPASVVKELLENAVDAGAKRVDIAIEGGGTGLIRITDDGIGMDRADALLCLDRHATSKIRDVTDLDTVGTLGFRGEAVPSIASVSRFTLTTRTADETEGTRLVVEGGALGDVCEAGAAPGTSIEVRDLFYNVPARLKFLKRPATEMSHISDAVERVALAHPDIAIRLTNEGRSMMDVPPITPTDPRGWLGRILGKKTAEHLYEVPESDSGTGVRVRGWVASPEHTERTARGVRTFVNGRFIRDRTIQHAVQDAYRTLMERGRHPVVVLWIDVEPQLIDVNVHPQKTEVRFVRSSDVHRAISRSLGRTLASQPWLQPLGFGQPSQSADLQPSLGRAPAGAVQRYTLNSDPSLTGGLDEHRARVADAVAAVREGRVGVPAWRPDAPAWRPEAGAPSEPWSFVPAAPQPDAVQPRFATLEPVGQVLSTYLVCQGPDHMVMIDQHAAHERIAFERMKTQYRDGHVEVQPLLMPQTIELDLARAQIATDEAQRLTAIGFELEPFGDSTWLLKAVPATLSGAAIERVLLDVIDELKSIGESSSFDEAIEAMLSCAACHAVVRAGDRLGKEEIRALLVQMDAIDFGAHCPHGRPVFTVWSADELGKLFHRS